MARRRSIISYGTGYPNSQIFEGPGKSKTGRKEWGPALISCMKAGGGLTPRACKSPGKFLFRSAGEERGSSTGEKGGGTQSGQSSTLREHGKPYLTVPFRRVSWQRFTRRVEGRPSGEGRRVGGKPTDNWSPSNGERLGNH